MGELVLACVEGASVHRLLRAHPQIDVAFAVCPVLLALSAKVFHDDVLLDEGQIHN